MYIWARKNESKDYNGCITQNVDEFGYIPLNDLVTYQGPLVIWENTPSVLEAHKLIRQSGVPKFLKCRIPVTTQLNPDKW